MTILTSLTPLTTHYQACTVTSKRRRLHDTKRTDEQTYARTYQQEHTRYYDQTQWIGTITSDDNDYTDNDYTDLYPQIVLTPTESLMFSCNVPRVIVLEHELEDDVFEDETLYYKPQTAYLKTSHSTKSLNSNKVNNNVGYERDKSDSKLKSRMTTVWGEVRRRGKEKWGSWKTANKLYLSKRLTRAVFVRVGKLPIFLRYRRENYHSSLRDLSNVEVKVLCY